MAGSAEHQPRVSWRFLGAVFCLAVAVRVLLLPADLTPRPGSDFEEYDTCAWNLAQGRGHRGPSPGYPDGEHLTSWRMPGPALVFAAVYRLVGHEPRAAVLVNVLFDAATAVALCFLGTMLGGPWTGRLAALGYGVWPHAIYLSTNLFSEPLFILLFILFLLHSLRMAHRPQPAAVLLNGVLLGAMLYARPHVLLLPCVALWIALIHARQPRRALAPAAALAVAMLTLVPWVIRNHRVHGAFIPFSTMANDVLLLGNNPVVANDPAWYGHSLGSPRQVPEWEHAYDDVVGEVAWSRRSGELVRRWLRDNPDKWWLLTRNKFLRFWTPVLQQPSRRNRLVMLASWGPVLLLFPVPFVLTGWRWLRQRDPRVLIHLAVLSFVANALILGGAVRYRAPIEGLCLIFAARALVWLWERRLPRPGLPAPA